MQDDIEKKAALMALKNIESFLRKSFIQKNMPDRHGESMGDEPPESIEEALRKEAPGENDFLNLSSDADRPEIEIEIEPEAEVDPHHGKMGEHMSGELIGDSQEDPTKKYTEFVFKSLNKMHENNMPNLEKMP